MICESAKLDWEDSFQRVLMLGDGFLAPVLLKIEVVERIIRGINFLSLD